MIDKLSAIPPLGKSAEEVEAEDANRVNPSTPSEALAEGVGDVPLVPNPNLANNTLPSAGVPVPASVSPDTPVNPDEEGRA